MRMVRFLTAAFAAALLAFTTLPASAKLLIEIDKSVQRMTVSEDGARLYVWPVSTGVARYDTPNGSFTPFRMERDHFSKEWDDAPMPNSIFFTKQGHAIHGTNHSSIGRPASHGCVRLSVEHSRVLFDLVKHEGMSNTRVVLVGNIPYGGPPAMVRRSPPGYWQGGAAAGYGQRDDDDDVTGSIPASRPVYRGRYPDGTPYYSDRGTPTYGDSEPSYYRRAPQPFFLPGPRSPWD